jgi:hypothetical protein
VAQIQGTSDTQTIYKGGKLREAIRHVAAGSRSSVDYKLFAGAATWIPGQLEAELEVVLLVTTYVKLPELSLSYVYLQMTERSLDRGVNTQSLAADL